MDDDKWKQVARQLVIALQQCLDFGLDYRFRASEQDRKIGQLLENQAHEAIEEWRRVNNG